MPGSVTALLLIAIELSLPHHGKSEIRLEGRKVQYSRREAGKTASVEKVLSESNARKLRAILLDSKPSYSSWKSEIDCFQLVTWFVQIGDRKIKICRDPQAIEILCDFHSAVQSVMRPTQ